MTVISIKNPARVPGDMHAEHPRSAAELSALVDALCKQRAFPDPVSSIERKETHISELLLTGEHVYKFKKPVDLGFVNFSDPDSRHFFCDEELRLNNRLAADLYEEVVPVTGTLEEPHIGGSGPVLEYAVKMRQFPEGQQLDELATRGELKSWQMDQLCRDLARFHQSLPAAPEDSPYGDLEEVRRPVLENFNQIRPHVHDTTARRVLEEVQRWSEQQLLQRRSDFMARKSGGHIRECHGDLHLGNMALWDGKVRIFDCLEFNKHLRWIDTISDLAFLVMDLDHRGLHATGIRFLDQYLEYTGDYLGLSVLRFYLVYRAMVRAKVAIIQAGQLDDRQERDRRWQEFHSYLNLAKIYTQPFDTTPLIITHGLSGSGKSWVTQRVLEGMTALRVRSDVERKRLFGLDPCSKAPSGVGEGIYTDDVTKETYRRLYATAYMIIDAGYPAILDATFLSKQQRDYICHTAQTCGVPFVILDVQASEDTLRERIARRMRESADPSDASFEVLEHQLATQEPLTDEEWTHRVIVMNDGEVNISRVIEEIQEMAARQASGLHTHNCG